MPPYCVPSWRTGPSAARARVASTPHGAAGEVGSSAPAAGAGAEKARPSHTHKKEQPNRTEQRARSDKREKGSLARLLACSLACQRRRKNRQLLPQSFRTRTSTPTEILNRSREAQRKLTDFWPPFWTILDRSFGRCFYLRKLVHICKCSPRATGDGNSLTTARFSGSHCGAHTAK